MPDLVLEASDDLVARIAREGDALRAIVELVWNAVDAEAAEVSVRLERDDSGAIARVHVHDDGHGISSDEVRATFGRIGGSWKAVAERSKNGARRLHGKLGEGRLRAFALGSRITWVSRSDNTAGTRELVTISGSQATRARFRWEAEATNAPSTGTAFTADNEQQRSLGALEADSALPILRAQFAPLLLSDTSLTITYDGITLDPSQEISHDTTLPFTFGEDDVHEANLRVIEWRSGKHRAVYFGPDSEHFPFETSGDGFERQFAYTAYVTWAELTVEQMSQLGLGDLAPGDVGTLWSATREAVHEHFLTRRRERRREQVEKWKDTGVYPYPATEPTSDTERAERVLFDVVSGTLVPHISNSRKQAQLTLQLLRDAIRHDPDKLTTILHEVVTLSPSDRDALTKLLSETTLSAIIRSANLVASRQKFLVALEHLLFDPNDSDAVGERDHLHKLLEHELWIFGESYHLMSSERSLTDLLRNHLKLEGFPSSDVKTVKRWDGKTGRTDLHLAALSREHDRFRHLVVELKAPSITAKRKEMDQVEDYANAILSAPAFASDRSSWDIVLVVTNFDDVVRRRIKSDDPELGLILDPDPEAGHPAVRVYVRRWRDVIDENRRRLDFFASALEHDPSIAEGLDYVRSEYGSLLPEKVQETPPESA